MHLQYSLTSFTDVNDSTKLLPMDEFDDLTTVKIESKSKVNAQKGRKDRKRASSLQPCINSNNEEEMDLFPQTTSASAVPLRIRRKPLPSVAQKLSKPKGHDDDSVEEQRFDSLNEFSIEESAHIFAQPLEKPSLDQKGTNDNKNSIEEVNYSQIITECKCIRNHELLELAN